MFRLVRIAILISCVYAGPVPRVLNGRIIGGTNTTIEKHPYQISLQLLHICGGLHFCGGSLISESYIVTAAHCLEGFSPAELQVRVGSTNSSEGGMLVDIESFRLHEAYNTYTLLNDIAVIKLKKPVQKSSAIGFVELPIEPVKHGATAIVTGWGLTCNEWDCLGSENLLEVSVKIIDQKTCASNAYKYGSSILDSMICAGEMNSDACQGDSGGPLVSNGKLVGVVSSGYICASKDYPGVYTDVVQFSDWIVKTKADM